MKEPLRHWIPSAEFANVQVVLPAGLETTWHGLATHVTGAWVVVVVVALVTAVHTPAAQVACAELVRVQLLPSTEFE